VFCHALFVVPIDLETLARRPERSQETPETGRGARDEDSLCSRLRLEQTRVTHHWIPSPGFPIATVFDNIQPLMYDTRGVDSIATITELRSETSDLIQRVQSAENGVLIQKNNEPSAVLIGWDTYQQIKEKLDLDRLAELNE